MVAAVVSDGAHYWNVIGDDYETLYDNEWSRFEDSSTAEKLRDLVSRAPGGRILDIGCGTGQGYELLQDSRDRSGYVGLDISPVMLRKFALRRPHVKKVLASASTLATLFPAGSFDIVIAINAAASFPLDTGKMLTDVAMLLSVGGVAYLSFLNRYSLRRLLRGTLGGCEHYRTRGDSRSDVFVPAATVSGRALRLLLRRAGFTVVEIRWRSVLGGVWESEGSIRVERYLQSLVPQIGHMVEVTGFRGGGGNE